MAEENFDLVEKLQTYNNSKGLRNDKAYKLLVENKVDTNEYLGVDKEVAAGTYPIKEKDPKVQKVNEEGFIKDLLEFGNELKDSDVVTSIKSRLPEGFVNIADFGTNIFNTFDKFFSLDPNYDRSEIFNKWSDNLENTRNKLQEKREDIEGTMTDWVGMIVQDMPAYYAIDRVLKKAKVKLKHRVPLAVGLSYAMSFHETEEDVFVNSETVKDIKHLLNILPDTPENQLTDDLIQMGVGYGGTKLIQGVVPALKFIKRNVKPEAVSDVAKLTAAGTVAAGSVAATQAKGEEIPEPINPNEKPTIDISNVKPLEMGATSAFTKLGEKVLPKIIEKGKEIIAPVFKSNVVEAVNKIPNKGSGDQILGQIKNIPGVKETELKWIGLDDFLKNKKSVTKQEVSEFVQSNRIDVNEVKFGGKAPKFEESNELGGMINAFEDKWLKSQKPSIVQFLDEPGYRRSILYRNLNYDVYAVTLGKIGDEPGRMDFNTLASVIGEDVTEASFKKMPNGLLRWTNNTELPTAKEGSYLFIRPLELEKYKVENAKRNFKGKGSKPKFEQYTEPGGKDYTELVFSLKTGGKDIGIPVTTAAEGKQLVPFKGGHFNKRNEIAHVRFKTRDLNGKKILTVEEMQSDFGIAMSRPGAKKVTDFPFRQNWYEMVTKRLIRYAADNGFDAVAIPKGSVAAKRYGQSIDKVKKIVVQPTVDHGGLYKPNYNFTTLYYNDAGKIVNERTFVSNDIYLLEKEIGAKNFKNLKDNIDEVFEKSLTKDDLRNTEFFADLEKEIIIGSGKGKAELYDKAIPSFMKKYGKKWNAKVYDEKFKTQYVNKEKTFAGPPKEMPVTILEITPAMKKAVQEGSQSLFEILGIATSGAVASKAVSDNQRNNTISNLTN